MGTTTPSLETNRHLRSNSNTNPQLNPNPIPYLYIPKSYRQVNNNNNINK